MIRKILFLIGLLLLTLLARATTTKIREGIHLFYQPEENGDYKLYLFPTGKVLVCEEQALHLIEPADPTHDPLIIECKHDSGSWIKSVRPGP